MSKPDTLLEPLAKRLPEVEILRLFLESANDAAFVLINHKIQFANPKTFEIVGYKQEELSETPFRDIIHPDDQELVTKTCQKQLDGNTISAFAFRVITKEQKTIWIALNNTLFHWEDQSVLLCWASDLTNIKTLEKKLKRAEKLKLVGTMAGEVAHDLNNILSGIVSYPELLLMQIDEDSPLREPIAVIHDSGQKAADMVNDLLTLTRRGIIKQKIINLSNILEEHFRSPAHSRLEQNYPDIRFIADAKADLLNIRGSATHISKVVMNLVFNAAEAVQNEGIVKVECFNKYIDEPVSGYTNIKEGDYVVLRVSDNGKGIQESDLKRIFEPFYTKKQMGRSGSGLGLSVVWNTVKDHKGHIEVFSEDSIGTVFELYFPTTRQAPEKYEVDFDINLYKGNFETVLVIDDIERQREIATGCLKLLHYSPIAVASGEAAEIFLKKNTVDLIILDMKMEPGIDGFETYRRIIKINPYQKAIIASGLSENEKIHKTLALGAGLYIRKPYTLKKFALAIKKELYPDV